MSDLDNPRPISAARRRWLEQETRTWADRQIITQPQASAILAGYASSTDLARQQARRLFLALCGVGLVMVGVGVLLLIGYNWDVLGRTTKTALNLGAVAVAFAAAAWAYAKDRPILGELTAFLGTLFFGCGIWLLAQVYHIQAHYPNGVLWWALGALVTAHLLRSIVIGLEATLLLGIWVGCELGDFQRPTFWFLPLALLVAWLALRLRSRLVMLGAMAAMATWLLMLLGPLWDLPALPGASAMALLGCAFFGLAQSPALERSMSRAMVVGAVALLLAAILPLTFHDVFYEEWQNSDALSAPVWPVLAVVAVELTIALGFLCWRAVRRELAVDWPMLVATLVLGASALTWIISPAWTEHQLRFNDVTLAVVYNGLALGLGIWLIFRGLQRDRGLSFFTGVAYMLLIVILRWVDLISDMLSSALLFFLAAAVMFATAWYWRRRKLAKLAVGEVSHE